MIDRLVEVILPSKHAWQRLALHGEGLGEWSGYTAQCYIQLGKDANEVNVSETLSHEFLHCLLLMWVSREAADTLDVLWYGYKGFLDIPIEFKELLGGITHSGIGFPEENHESHSN